MAFTPFFTWYSMLMSTGRHIPAYSALPEDSYGLFRLHVDDIRVVSSASLIEYVTGVSKSSRDVELLFCLNGPPLLQNKVKTFRTFWNRHTSRRDLIGRSSRMGVK